MLVVLNYILVGRPWVFREPRFCQNSRLLFILKFFLFRLPVSTLTALSIFPQPCPQPRHLALCKIAFELTHDRYRGTRWGETFS